MIISFRFFLLLSLFLMGNISHSIAYEDHTHYSRVFGKERTYRIFFPENYQSSDENYPVIYLFHGWGGRYFKDPSANFHFEKMDSLVKNNKVIMVMWDGNIDPDQPRPYNIGLEAHMKYEVQFKDYFLELVNHVDSTYRTLPNRPNRALMGFSMGGFMAYFLAGKYPDMVCAAVNFVGSPEFYVGYPDNHTLYPIRHSFQNLHGIRLRFQNSENGEISYLNREVIAGAQREAALDFEYEQAPGGHRIDIAGAYKNFQKSFNFVLGALDNPLPKPKKWHHIDLYKTFEVWDYKVKSDKKVPGFIALQDVTKNGFTINTQKWLPDGPPIPGVNINLKTGPLYRPNQQFTITDFQPHQNKINTYTKKSDADGRLHFNFDHQKHHITIKNQSQQADLIISGYKAGGKKEGFIPSGKATTVKLQLFNRGRDLKKPIFLTLSSPDEQTLVQPNEIRIPPIKEEDTVWTQEIFKITTYKQPPNDGSPHKIRLHASFEDGEGNQQIEQLDIPVFYNVRPFSDIAIDDGISRDTSGLVLGRGNGNGIPEPGEKIMVYTNGHRTNLSTSANCISDQMEESYIEVIPSSWSDGFTQSSILKIRSNCPQGKTINLVGFYETKEYAMNRRIRHWGKVELNIGK